MRWSLTLAALGLAGLGAGALALRRARAVTVRAHATQVALRRVATGVVTAPEDAMALIADEAAGLTRADTALVAEFRAGHVFATTARRTVSPYRTLSFPLAADGALAEVVRSGRPVHVDDYGELSPEDSARRDDVWGDNLGCSVAVPVYVGEHLWGSLMVVRRRPRSLPADTGERLAYFAELIVAAITAAEARRELTRQATTDPLTGLANRRAFEHRLDDEQQIARRTGRPLSLAMIDIDHFKDVNDRHGHGVGDEVLVEIAERLSREARPQDLFARIGGEEFAWLITDADEDQAHAVAERARRAVASSPFAKAGALTISVGVCTAGTGPGTGGLMRGADVALYWAKEHGRNRCGRYSRVVAESPPAPA
jgi:diguanylate cyclase (GGDEF)-like protein